MARKTAARVDRRARSTNRRVLSDFYRIRVEGGQRTLKRGVLKIKKVSTARNSQKREAERIAKRFMRRHGAGSRAEVRTKEGALIYQAKLWYLPNTNILAPIALEL
jgi:hypothetical protein